MTERNHPCYHPSEARLLDYAAGSMPEPVALLVATHLALCPKCRQESKQLDGIGGALIEELEPVALTEDGLARMLARLERDDEDAVDDRPVRARGGDPSLPEPLRGYVGETLAALPWRRLGPIGQVSLLPEFTGVTTRLLSIRAGATMPSHTHDGSELTLVLRGGFCDASGHYMRGDVAEADSEVDHRPVADEGEDCLCLAVTDAPLRLTGKLGRLVNPFVRI